MAVELVNLTPHEIRILNEDGSTVIVPPSGNVARVTTSYRSIGAAGDVELFTQEVGEVAGLPDPSNEKLFIVSALVRLAHPERGDIASPGELVRNASGQPVGCRGLVVNRAGMA